MLDMYWRCCQVMERMTVNDSEWQWMTKRNVWCEQRVEQLVCFPSFSMFFAFFSHCSVLFRCFRVVSVVSVVRLTWSCAGVINTLQVHKGAVNCVEPGASASDDWRRWASDPNAPNATSQKLLLLLLLLWGSTLWRALWWPHAVIRRLDWGWTGVELGWTMLNF